MNRKSVVFTFITVILLSIIIIAFLVNINNRTQTSIQTSNVKVETLNNFVKDLNSSYLPDALRASSNQAMLSLIDYESNKSSYISNAERYFRDVILDGYYGTEKQQDIFQNNLNYTLPYALNEVKRLASQQGTIFEYSQFDINNLQVLQEDPWHVKVSLNMNYLLSDAKSGINWTIRNRKIYTLIDIQNYRDPLYLIENKLGVSLMITKTPYTSFFDINMFKDHINKAYFRSNPGAPEFLSRLQGNLDASAYGSAYGIESLLDPVYYTNSDLYSNVDYLFFTKIPGKCVDNMPENFRLDDSHLDYYRRSNNICTPQQ